jgi:hypothetical protein
MDIFERQRVAVEFNKRRKKKKKKEEDGESNELEKGKML